MSYLPTEYEYEALSDAIRHAQKEREKARRRKSVEYVAPIIDLNMRTVSRGRFAPDNASEFKDLIDMFASITAEDFQSQDIYGVTGFDMKYAAIVNERWTQETTSRISRYQQDLNQLKDRLSSTRNQDERDFINRQIDAVTQLIAKQEGYAQFNPANARDKRQFKSRVYGRQASYSESFQTIQQEVFKERFLKSLRAQGISSNSSEYRKVKNMSLPDFMDMVNANPDLHDSFNYQLSDTGVPEKIRSVIDNWGLSIDAYEGEEEG